MRPDVIPRTLEVRKDSTGEENSTGKDNSTGDIEVVGDLSEAATFVPQKLPQSGLFKNFDKKFLPQFGTFQLGFEVAKILAKIFAPVWNVPTEL